MTILNHLPSLYLMSACSVCSSLDSIEEKGAKYCSGCGIFIEDIFDNDIAFRIYPKEGSKSNYNKPKRKPLRKMSRVERLLHFTKLEENKKSEAHELGLIHIENYRSKKYSGYSPKKYSEKVVNDQEYFVIEQATKALNEGIKKQTKEARHQNKDISRTHMFMPSGLLHSPLYAAYASLLYAERMESQEWQKGLTPMAEYIYDEIRPKAKNGNRIPYVKIKKQLLSSYRRLFKSLGPRKSKISQIPKSMILKKYFDSCINLYVQKTENRTDDDLIELFTIFKNKLDAEQYRKELELEISQSGMDTLSAEILYQLIKSSGQKITRKSLCMIMNQKKRISDKQEMVRRIFSIIELNI